MAEVELFLPADGYENKVLLSIRSPKGHLIGVGDVDLTGLRYGAFSAIDEVDGDEMEELLMEVARAAADVIERKIDLVRQLHATAQRDRRKRA